MSHSFRPYMTVEKAVLIAGHVLSAYADDREARMTVWRAAGETGVLPFSDTDKERLRRVKELARLFPEDIVPILSAYMTEGES